MVQRTYYPPPDAEPPAPKQQQPLGLDDVHTVRHGYNLADLDQLAHIAVQRAWGHSLARATRYELAWSGIAEALCAAEKRPDPADLIQAGWRAVNRYQLDEARHDGISTETWQPMPGFSRYWSITARPTSSPELRIVERAALWQIWPTLTNGQRRALLALAACEDYEQAAGSLGITPASFRLVISNARRRFLERWHEGEKPSRPWHAGRRIGHRHGLDQYGKPRITVSQLEKIRARHHAGETLTAIGADYGVKKACLSSLLNGRTKPAPDAEFR